MAVSLSDIQTGVENLPPRLMVYGVEGIGKTKLAASAPKPIFISTEDGMGIIDAPRFPLSESYEDVDAALRVLATEDHDYKTLAVDTLDWLEPLIWKKVIKDNPQTEKGKAVVNIEDYGYGKGFGYAMDYWQDFISALNYLRTAKGMTVILLAHSEVKRYDDPTSDPYDRYQPKFQKAAVAKIKEWSDAILFANYRVATKESDVGFNQKKTRAIGQGERLLFTQERPAWIAKNRYSMPPELPMPQADPWTPLSACIPFFSSNS